MSCDTEVCEALTQAPSGDKEGSRRGVAVVHECTLVDRSILWKKEPLISPEARAYVPRAVRPTNCIELPMRKKRE
mgnify:CR=1 FL=1